MLAVSGTSQLRIPVCLSIAGSDSGGGAGIQADLKAFARQGVHGTTAITAITAQNTVGVLGVEAVSPAMIVEQVRAVVEDIGVDAVKVGMLGSVASAQAVGRALDLLPAGTPVVVDPVMVAESGARLLDADAQDALVDLVLSRATVVTPNLPEARVLAGDGELEVADLARAVHALGPPPSSSPAVIARRSPTCSSTVSGSSRSPASASPTAPRTARAARTRRRSPRAWRSATTWSTRRARPSAWPPRRSATGCAGSGGARGRLTSSGSARRPAWKLGGL